ncbi:MAG TPA: hypothetical protein VGF28_06710 [Thermoanaerobaculia bacterium]|jgi:hypothetical protein
MTVDRRHDLLALGTIAAIVTLYFFDVVAGTGVFYTRDVASYHFPLKAILRTVVENGEFPYWNPFLFAGQPLAANPTYGVFYPPTWLIMLPSLVYGFSWHVLLHVYVAAFGMYALLRSFGTTRGAGCIGALSFALGGLVLSSVSMFPLIFNAAWLPWTCLFTRRFLLGRSRRDFALAAVSLAMQLLIGEPVTVLQTGLLLGLYALSRKSRIAALAVVAAISVTALLLSAVQILPTVDHARDSVRAGGFDFATVSDWSTPPRRVVEIVYPRAEPYAGALVYPGRRSPLFLSIYSGLVIGVMVLAGMGARVRGLPLYLATVSVSLFLAFGSHTPLLRLLYDAGIVRSIRYPEKFLMMGIFATVVFSAVVLDELLRGSIRVRGMALAIAAATAGVAALMAQPLDIVRGVVLAAIVFGVTRLRRHLIVALLGLFMLADLFPVLTLAPRIQPEFYTQPPPVLRRLAPDHGRYRLFPIANWAQPARGDTVMTPDRFVIERNGLDAFTSAAYGVRSAIDIDFDLTSLRVSDELAKAAWQLQKVSPRWLDSIAAMSNVRYVTVRQPPAPAAGEAGADARRMEPIRIVEGAPHPRYYFATGLATARSRNELVAALASGRYGNRTAFVADETFQPAPGRVLRATDSANRARIEVDTAGTSFLVMSVTAHKYWTVTIDGVDVTPIVTNLAYQGVVVPRGRHVVEMRYHNPLVAAGAAVSFATLLALLYAHRRRTGPPAEAAKALREAAAIRP